MTVERSDVLVVGGGPAGAVAAAELAKAGVRVTLIDRATFPREKTCGESLSPGAVTRLKTLGLWPAASEEASPLRSAMSVDGMRLTTSGGASFIGRYRQGLGASSGAVARRLHLDNHLLDAARRRGVTVFEGMQAVNAEMTRDGGGLVRARSVRGTASMNFDARRVVVADGRSSFLARQLGFLRDGARNGRAQRWAVRAHLDGVAEISSLAEMHVGRGGYCGAAPLSPVSANVCYVLFGNRVDVTGRDLESAFRRDLARFPEMAQRLAGSRFMGPVSVIGPLRLAPGPHSTSGPFVACGDTTGFLDPFTGEGIAHAIACGALAARAVRESIQGNSAAFSSYEREVQALRRLKGPAANLLYALVARPTLADLTGNVFARFPSLADRAVRLFGDQV